MVVTGAKTGLNQGARGPRTTVTGPCKAEGLGSAVPPKSISGDNERWGAASVWGK